MKIKYIFFIILQFTANSIFCQIMFQRHYGGTENDGGSCVIQTDDGGFLVAGQTESFGNGGRDIYLIKTDEFGDTLWTRTFGGNSNDQSSIILNASDNKYMLVGMTSSYGNGGSNIYAVYITESGDTIWTKAYGGSEDDCGYGGVQYNDSTFFIVGDVMSSSPVFNSVFILKINKNGDTLWGKRYEKKTANYGFYIIETDSSEYLIAGSTADVGDNSSRDCYIIKTDINGDTVWTRIYGGIDDDQAFSECLASDGGYIISGSTKSFGQGGFDIFLMKIDTYGNQIWFKTYGGTADDWGGMVRPTNDNGYIITGYTENYGAGGKDIYIIKTDVNGDTLWTRTFGGTQDEWGSIVRQTADNGYIISGYTNSYGANYDVLLIKTNEFGIVGFEKIFDVQRDFKVFPNPNNGTFYIETVLEKYHDLSLNIFNISGQLVYSKYRLFKHDKEERIELSDFDEGIYIINIQGANIFSSKKIIIKK